MVYAASFGFRPNRTHLSYAHCDFQTLRCAIPVFCPFEAPFENVSFFLRICWPSPGSDPTPSHNHQIIVTSIWSSQQYPTSRLWLSSRWWSYQSRRPPQFFTGSFLGGQCSRLWEVGDLARSQPKVLTRFSKHTWPRVSFDLSIFLKALCLLLTPP